MQQLNGALTGKIKEIRGKIIHEIAFIESALDDPEHVGIDGYGENLLIIIEKLMQKMNQMIASSENGSLLKEGINTVIVGKPNAGKIFFIKCTGRKRAGNCYGYCRNYP